MDIIIDKTRAGKSVRDILTLELGFSSNMIKKLKFSEDGILVDGRFVTVRHLLSEGEVLSLAVEDKASDVSPYTIPVDLPLSVVYEDEFVTAVNKPPSMPAHPSLGHKLDTVSNALAYRYRDKSYVFRPVNRLDRDTSGCMLTANTKAAAYKMYLSMTGGRIKKQYIAVTDGVPCGIPPRGELHSYLRRKEGSIVQREVTAADDPDGKEAVTEYEVLVSSDSHSVFLLSPITGRTHQIRVQLASVGCPVTGDDMYGTSSDLISRQALHSWRCEFPHPSDQSLVTVTAPLHEDMLRLIYALFPGGDEMLRGILPEMGGKDEYS